MRRRIVASIVGVTAVALLLLGVPLAFSVERLYANQEVLRLEREASEARGAINPGSIATHDPIEVAHEGDIRYGVYDTPRRRIAGVGPARADAVVRAALAGDTHDRRSGGRVVVALPITGNERVVGAVRASRPERVISDRVHETWLVIALITIGALAVAALLARWQARRLTRPVDALVATADQLGAGDFATRTTPSGLQELDQLGAALDSTAERLGDLVARERAFSADASHQLRTPITGLRVRVESALHAPDADLRRALEETLTPIDQLDAIVENLLALARDTHAQRSPLDVEQLLRDVESSWHGRLAAEGRPLRVHAEPGCGAPLVAAPAVREVLEVLVSNAHRHGAGVVAVRAHRVAGAVAIDVTDDGEGVHDPDHVFERRTASTHGIGLALARTLAEAEGGRLVLERRGPAPTFRAIFPCA